MVKFEINILKESKNIDSLKYRYNHALNLNSRKIKKKYTFNNWEQIKLNWNWLLTKLMTKPYKEIIQNYITMVFLENGIYPKVKKPKQKKKKKIVRWEKDL